MKLCKDCKHYRKLIGSDGCVIDGMEFDGCVKPASLANRVHGGQWESSGTFDLFCIEQRADISHVPNRCGKEGNNWEPK
jgi:hypothetical protein